MPGFRKAGMIVLSSPSGAGKTTLVKKISKNRNYSISISHTTRLPRPNEKNGKDYFFISKNNFKKLIKKKEFLEHAKVFDNYYGSSKKLVIDKLKKGQNIVFDIDWQGTRQIRNKRLNYKLLTIFILPPSKAELLKRLKKREKKNMKTVRKRMKEFKKDMLKWKEYDHVVINDDLNNCYKKIMRVIKTSSEITTDLPFIKNHVKKLLN
jgi:guanylate kinase|tara:strand:- start:170 stop:793 length:624 start_codon:yes stop_codon:yes gene_type:complete